jgi:hypothetical protein
MIRLKIQSEKQDNESHDNRTSLVSLHDSIYNIVLKMII